MLRYLSLWDDLYLPSSHNELDILFLWETVSLFLPADSMDADKNISVRTVPFRLCM